VPEPDGFATFACQPLIAAQLFSRAVSVPPRKAVQSVSQTTLRIWSQPRLHENLDAHAPNIQSTSDRLKNPAQLPRLLRKQETWAERLVWGWLRDRRFSAYKFRRQHRFGPYILDFFCVEACLNIELDGGGHGFPQQRQADAERDGWLKARGVKILRFWNSRLRREKESIRDAIWRALQERAPQSIPEYCKSRDAHDKGVLVVGANWFSHVPLHLGGEGRDEAGLSTDSWSHLFCTPAQLPEVAAAYRRKYLTATVKSFGQGAVMTTSEPVMGCVSFNSSACKAT
jgi:very-short-patch-repair endonuclease